jgi:hypothetical protein
MDHEELLVLMMISRSGVYFMDTDSHMALSWMAGGSRLGLRLMSGPSLAPVRSNRLSKMSPVAAGDEAGIRQKGERQAAEQATSWVQAASQSGVRRRDLRMEQQNWRNDCQSGLRRDGGVQVMGCFERKRIARMMGWRKEKKTSGKNGVTASKW